jgi:adenylate cyclase
MLAPMASLSREELFQALEARIADPSRAEAIDREIWARCGVDRAIFVSDLSGFTRLTRQRGILHFLAVFRRATALSTPILERHGGRRVKFEADNHIYTFARATSAVAAAREIVAATSALDASLGEDERVYPCVGIGFGHVLELRDDVFGDEVNVAFKLGEDVATPREILLSEGALAQLEREGAALDADPREGELGHVRVRYHAVR